MEQGVAPAGVADVAASQGARSPAAPDEGAALSGCDLSDEGQRKCCLDNVSGLSPSVRRRSPVASSKIATCGAPEGAPAGNTAGGALPRCPSCLRLTGAPSLILRGKGREGAGPAPMTQRADESRLYDRCDARVQPDEIV